MKYLAKRILLISVLVASLIIGSATISGQDEENVLTIGWSNGYSTRPGHYHFKANYLLPGYILTGQGEIIPGLFESHEANETNDVYTFNIFEEAVWSDGQSITAQDFIDFWNFAYQPKYNWPGGSPTLGSVVGWNEFQAGEADSIEGLRAVDDKTLEITLVRGEGWFPFRMTNVDAAPMRLEMFAEVDAQEFDTPQDAQLALADTWWNEGATDIIASGPFTVDELVPEPDGIYNLVRNEMWWGAEQPSIDRINSVVVRDYQTLSLMFENEEVDLVSIILGGPAVQLINEYTDATFVLPQYSYHGMWLNTEIEPFNDQTFRQALLTAIDWDTLAQAAYEGEMPPSDDGSMFHPGLPCHVDDFSPFAFDVERAQELLAESSYANVENVPNIRIRINNDPPRVRAAQIIQEMWRTNLGLENVELQTEENEFSDGGTWGGIVASGGVSYPVPSEFFFSMFHSDSGSVIPTWHNASQEGFDERIDTLQGMDISADGYCEMIQELNEELHALAVGIPFNYLSLHYFVHPWVEGEITRSQSSGMYNIWTWDVAERP